MGKDVTGVSPSAMAVLERYDWPGNVRELANIIERAVILTDDRLVAPSTLPSPTENRSDRRLLRWKRRSAHKRRLQP